MSSTNPSDRSGGRRVDRFTFAWLLGKLALHRFVPRLMRQAGPLLVLSAICWWYGSKKIDNAWAPPLGVLLFGGIGLFAARGAGEDELHKDLVRNLVDGVRPSNRASSVSVDADCQTA